MNSSLFSLLFLYPIFATPIEEEKAEKLDNKEEIEDKQRDDRVFFAMIQIAPTECGTADEVRSSGTCLPRNDCVNLSGTPSGSCASGMGTCCLIQKSCNSATSYNNTYFTNRNYPSFDSGNGACTLTISRMSTNICQMRFDFVNLELNQPDSDGFCRSDFLTVTGGSMSSPMICGSNNGQHMYVDLDPSGGSVKLTVDRTAGSKTRRMWNIRAIQIPCNSRYRAPRGCLQYYTATSGTVNSFNFNQEMPAESSPISTRQIALLQYSVCIQNADGYCGITWTRNTTGGNFGFTVSGPADALMTGLEGTRESSTTGSECTADYVIIPDGIDELDTMNDRFCGLGFPESVTSKAIPFKLYVKTDSTEEPDTLNRGFSFDYRQTIC